ncbi:MAG: hypothetical protein ACOX5R_06845 [bacterium]
MKPETQHWSLVFLLLLIILSIRFSLADHSGIPEVGYVAEMAKSPYYGAYRPFSNRVLLPVFFNLIGYLPKPGEPWMPVAGSVLMGLGTALLLRVLGFSWCWVWLGVLCFSLSDGLIDILREFAVHNVDAASHVLILLALTAMRTQQDALFSLATMLGVLNRDWALVIIPGWYLYNYGFSLSTSNLLRWARVSLPSIAAYLLITQVYLPHTAISVIIQELEAVLPEFRISTADFYLRELRQLGISFWTQSVFSPAFYQFAWVAFWAPALAGTRFAPRNWNIFSLYYLLICLLQFIVARDVWRLSFYLYPVVLSLLLFWLRSISEVFSQRIALVLSTVLLAAFILWSDSYWLFFINGMLAGSIEWYRRMNIIR